MKTFYEKDADVNLIKNKKVAILVMEAKVTLTRLTLKIVG